MTQETERDTPHVHRIDGTIYDISSRTRQGLTHRVDIASGQCSCEAGQHHVDCWHIDFVRAVYYWTRYEQRAQRWPERAAHVEARKKEAVALTRPQGMAALQEAF